LGNSPAPRRVRLPQPFDGTDTALQDRERAAAECIGWVAIVHPDIPGRYQLQLANSDELNGVPVRGLDFLSAVEVLMACRDDLVPEDDDWEEMHWIRFDMLATLAQPFRPRIPAGASSASPPGT
jgi:hypothetical protein